MLLETHSLANIISNLLQHICLHLPMDPENLDCLVQMSLLRVGAAGQWISRLKTSVLFYETVVALIMLLQAQKPVHLKLCACPI